MKKLRVTPLNIGCALLAAWIIWTNFSGPIEWKSISLRIALLFTLVIADQFFRFFFKTIKRIWLVELGFTVFTALVIWIIR